MMDKVNQKIVVERSANVRGKDFLEAGALSPRKNKGTDEAETSDFSGELLQAQALVQNSPAPAVTPDFRLSLNGSKSDSTNELPGELNAKKPDAAADLAGAGSVVQARGLANKGVAEASLTGSVEKSPLSMKAAAGTNTAAAIAGLKPWSKDWIFEGDALKNPNLKPLFDSQPNGEAKKAETPEAARMIAQSRSRGEATDAGKLSSDVALSSDLQVMVQSNGEPLGAAGGAKVAAKVVGGAMGGSEFLNTLNSVRGGEAALQNTKADASGSGNEGTGSKSSGEGSEAGVGSGSKAVSGRAKRPAFEAETAGTLKSEHGNLRLLAGGLESMVSPMRNAPVASAPVEVTGNVVQGRMAQDRLSSESLSGISGGIRNLSLSGGGEMRVRLRPDNLGELNIHVTTQGNQVGLKIQASDEKAKKILEESIGHLKESMAGHRLELNQVDLTVAAAGNGATLNDGAQEHSQRHQQHSYASMDQGSAYGGFNDLTGQGRGSNGQGGLGRQAYDRLSNDEMTGASRAPVPGLGGINRGEMTGRLASGRLDVRA
jgi:flagellar hook-length control protein FliK